jgi:hypothetical protein
MDINELMITTGSVRCDRLFFLELLTESLRDKMTQIPLKYYRKKKKSQVSVSVLTPAIQATQGAEIRRIAFQSQPGQIVPETLSRKKPFTEKGWWSGSRCRP